MNKTIKQFEKLPEFFKSVSQILVGIAVVVAMTFVANAFTEPTQSPPSGNVSAPLNTSGTTQTKTGKLNFTWFEDQNQPGYYVDPGGTSKFNKINLGGVVRSSWPSSGGGIPSGMIAIFDTSCPSGWTRFSALDGRYPRGAASYGSTGGSGSHSHSGTTASAGSHSHSGTTASAGSHSHSGTTASAGSHSHSITVTSPFNYVSTAPGAYWAYAGQQDRFQTPTSSAGSHNHSFSTNSTGSHNHSFSTNSTGSHSHTFSTNAVSNIDPYRNVVFCKKN